MPQTVIHVGIGKAVGELNQWHTWPIGHALIVDANAEHLAAQEASISKHTHWLLANRVIAKQSTETIFYNANNPQEDGLIKPDQLSVLWSNLRTLQARKVLSVGLDELLTTSPYDAIKNQNNTWMIIECFPALDILQGAEQTLTAVDVIVTRCTQNDVNGLIDLHQYAIDDYLAAKDFICLGFFESNHPDVGFAVYGRDVESLRGSLATGTRQWQQTQLDLSTLQAQHMTTLQQMQALNVESDAHVKTTNLLHQQIEQLEQELRLQAQLAESRQEEVNRLTAERDQQASMAMERQQQIDQLVQARDEQVQLAQQRQVSLEQAIAERDQQAKTGAERQQQIDQLVQARDEQAHLAQQRQVSLEQITADRDQQAKTGAERQQQIDQLTDSLNHKQQALESLETQYSESQTRQVLLQEEMIKAEAQIELIKDLLLKDAW